MSPDPQFPNPHPSPHQQPNPQAPLSAPTSPWIDVHEAGLYIRQGEKTVYSLMRTRRLRHVRTASRGKLLTTKPWLDDYLCSLVVEVREVRR
jgi:hypothetical protein